MDRIALRLSLIQFPKNRLVQPRIMPGIRLDRAGVFAAMVGMEVANPVALFQDWLAEARQDARIAEPTAVALATVSPEGQPSVRMVLLKEVSEAGFVFYTNLGSRKAQDLSTNPRASLCFFWQVLGKQVRIEGRVQPVSAAQADAYFATRDRLAQIGAWASRQSHKQEHRYALERRVARRALEFGMGPVPRPPFWSGYCLVPVRIEFWLAGSFRLHDRFVFYRKEDGQWSEKEWLYP